MSSEQKVTRKLRAIFSADVKGYSILMANDEVATILTLQDYRNIMSAYVVKYDGRVVDAVGDNLLAEFGSAVDAVQCAVEVQKELRDKNKELSEEKRLEFRIGVNTGDVVQDGDRIYGDGVNIAARIEGLADAGGICISRNAYDHVKNKLELSFDYLGEHEVKNIMDPVQVYKVLLDSNSPESLVEEHLELPDNPSIAVLPFKNMSGDPQQEFFSDGFTEDIITTLAQIPQILVIARESSFTYKGKTLKVQEIGRDLGVRYILEGSIQKFGERIRITAQLIDATNGHHLWAEKYDRELKDIFAMRDEITLKIANALQVKLTYGEMANWGSPTPSVEAYIKTLQSWEHFNRLTPDDNILSRQRAKEALALDPNYSSAMEMLAWTLLMDGALGTSKTPEKSIEQAFELGQKILERGDSDAGAHFLIGYAYSKKGQFDRAISELEIALDLFPNNADINAGFGSVLNSAGMPEEAINVLKKAIRLNPIPPAWYLRNLGDAYRKMRQYENAIREYKKSVYLQPDNMFSHLNLALCYVKLGRNADAEAESTEVLRIDPKFSLESFRKSQLHKNQNDLDVKIDALRKAGIPEQSK
jgi:adenylate cyclase